MTAGAKGTPVIHVLSFTLSLLSSRKFNEPIIFWFARQTQQHPTTRSTVDKWLYDWSDQRPVASADRKIVVFWVLHNEERLD